jgi:hypothetical protein
MARSSETCVDGIVIATSSGLIGPALVHVKDACHGKNGAACWHLAGPAIAAAAVVYRQIGQDSDNPLEKAVKG